MKRSYYAIIPANVRYDNELTPNAKLLYGEITALCNEKGYCWASNSYFAELYKVSKETVSRWISNLETLGYIRTELIYEQGTKSVKERRIYICCDDPIDKNVNRYRQNNQYPIDENVNTPIDKNVKGNNTVFNNTSNNNYICAPVGARVYTAPSPGGSVEAEKVTATPDGDKLPEKSGPRSPFKSERQEQLFDEFWAQYPKKRSKGQAERAWVKIKPDEQLFKAILDGLERAKKSRDWLKNEGQFIPYPATWLNAKGWEDVHNDLMHREEEPEFDWGWTKET